METPPTLKFFSLDPPFPMDETILIIHGAFSSHAAFLHIGRLLAAKGYHVLLPDLPAHGSGTSGAIQPFRFSTSVSLLADLINQHAHNGKAYIVGFSLGGYLALNLAADHPDLVTRLYCSGAGRDWNWSPAKAHLASVVMYGMSKAPSFLGTWFNNKHKIVEPSELIEDGALWKDGRTLGLHHDVIGELAEFSSGDVLDRIKCPVLMVSANAHDPVDGQKVTCERLRNGGCEEVKGVELKGWPHAWNGRDPELFANSVIAWLVGKSLPKEFVDNC